MYGPEKGFAKYALFRIERMRIICSCLAFDILELRNRKWKGEKVPYKSDSLDEARQVIKVFNKVMDLLDEALKQMYEEEESTC